MAVSSSPFSSGAPRLSDYQHVRFLTRSRIAWEYLRRHPDYRHDWHMSAPERPQPIALSDGTVLLQARPHSMRAGAWGLCTFRRSCPERPCSRYFLAG